MVWCDGLRHSISIRHQEGSETEHPVGYLASVLYLRVQLLEKDSLSDLLGRLTEEYCNAYEHGDCSVLASCAPEWELTRNTLFNWIPEAAELDLSDLAESDAAIVCSTVDVGYPILMTYELDSEPVILLQGTRDEVIGSIHFPLSRFAANTMQRFARNLVEFISSLPRKTDGAVKDILLVP
jgi:hypothetical protein